jgi:hypothetical protein
LPAISKSDELVEEIVGEADDPETGVATKQYQTRKKYPNGRKIVVANGVLLRRRPNPYESGDFPFARSLTTAYRVNSGVSAKSRTCVARK